MRNYETDSASWVIRTKADSAVLFETFDHAIVAKLNTEKYEAVSILDYLGEFNRQVREMVEAQS